MMNIKQIFFIFLTTWALNYTIVSAEMNPGDNSKTTLDEKSIEAVENGLRYVVVGPDNRLQLMNLLDRMKHFNAPGVSIAVIDKGKLAWAKGYGTLSNAPDSKTVDTNTLFQAASVSKSFAAVGALLLVQ